MLGIFLRILSILGIILLILLALIVGGLLLVLFFPVSYGISGSKDVSGLRLTVKVKWLLGLLGVQCRYPEPGEIRVRLLFFTLFRRKLFAADEEEKASGKKRRKKGGKKSRKKAEKPKGRAAADKGGKKQESEKENQQESKPDVSGKEDASMKTENVPENPVSDASVKPENMPDGPVSEEASETETDTPENAEPVPEEPVSKLKKIKCTIGGIYDKIKKIRENISYYAELLQKEEIRLLLSDSLLAAGKILKSVGPSRIRADIRFGTGAPDTTGYLYGAYCMAAAFFGPEVRVTPDFEEAVAEFEFDISGRILVWILLVNGLKMYKLIRRLGAGKAKPAEALRNGGENGR